MSGECPVRLRQVLIFHQARIKEIDATRGAAMVGVFVSHASDLVQGQWRTSPGAEMITLGLFATPTFLLLSGTLCGIMSLADHDSNANYRWRLLDRGLFLLIVGHVVLSLIHGLWGPFATAFGRSFYTTDAVGCGLIVAAFIPRQTSMRRLFLCGVSLLLSTWLVGAMLEPTVPLTRSLFRLCFGLPDNSDQEEGYIVPLLPYLGIFMIGMAFGKRYYTWSAAGKNASVLARRFIQLGVICIAIAISLKMSWLVTKPHLSNSLRQTVYLLTEPRQKLPPGLAYVLAFGGFGLVMAGLAHGAERFAIGRIALSFLATFGRASLVVFMANFLIYRFPARVFNINQFGLSMLVIFPASVLLLWGIAWAWDKGRCSRYLTLGLRRVGQS